MRSLTDRRVGSLTAAEDDISLEGIIGDLQSEWGVPQYPQEFKITLKVASEERDARSPAATSVAPAGPVPGSGGAATGRSGPRREKAPAAPRVAASPGGDDTSPPQSRRRRSRRRRKRS